MFSFCKMQATGNDFIIINYLDTKLEYSYKLLSEFLCDRHFGVGADGVLIIEKSNIAEFKMRIFNKDGTEAEMCGNGIRCFAKYVFEKNFTNKKEFGIETISGIKKINLEVEGDTVINIEVDMGKPIFELEKIPVLFFNNIKKGYINIEGIELDPVSIGNPHAVCYTNDLENLDINKYGSLIENYKYFPNRTNVEFVQIVDDNEIRVRIWERGVGETYSCGTGACAAVVISNKYKSTKSEVKVDLLGGKLKIKYNSNIKLIGTAEFVFDGRIEI